MCTKGSSSYASSSFARARSAARSRPNDPSFARPFDDAAAAVRDDAPARARDARARDARTRTASRIVARAAGRAVVIARALCTAHARRAAACEHAIASRSGASLFSLRGAGDAGDSETMRVFDALDWIQRAAGKQYVEFYRYYVSKSPPVATRAVAWTTRAPLCASESLSVSLL